MPAAAFGDTVTVHYSGRLGDGTLFDTSIGGEPLEFTIGAGQIIAGFEEAVVGMQPGESKVATIGPEKAYGHHRQELSVEVNRSELPPSLDLKVGETLELTKDGGGAIMVTVTGVSDSSVTLDANHPLAGLELEFEIELVAIG